MSPEAVRTPHSPISDQINDPDSAAVRAALTRHCDGCGAPAGQLCHNHIRPGHPLPGRLVHFGRLEKP